MSLTSRDVTWGDPLSGAALGALGGARRGNAARYSLRQLERGAAAAMRAPAPGQQPPAQPNLADGGGAYTCQDYDPDTQALQANATIIRRLILRKPLPVAAPSVAGASVDAVVAALAAEFGMPTSTLRLAQAPVDADRSDALGMRHIRLEQVQPYMGDLFG